jgi:hypothetical protein
VDVTASLDVMERRKLSLPLSGIEFQCPGRSTSSQVTTRLSYPDFQNMFFFSRCGPYLMICKKKQFMTSCSIESPLFNILPSKFMNSTVFCDLTLRSLVGRYQEVTSSNLGQDTCYPEIYLKRCHNSFLPHPFQFTIRHHLVIRHYISETATLCQSCVKVKLSL